MRTPLKTAPPPASAVLSMLVLLCTSLTYLPPALTQIHDVEARPDTFTDRVYPQAVSVPSLTAVRLLFGLLCWSVTIYSILRRSYHVKTFYIRPDSKLLDAKIKISGIRHLYPLTSWSWMLLGTHFLFSGVATGWCYYYAPTTPPRWFLVLTLILWKIAAPITLLIGVVVKYVLWPAAIKNSGPDHTLKSPVQLMQHNANILMALTELLFLGGIAFDSNDEDENHVCAWMYICLSVIYGIAYIFFSWATNTHWNRTSEDPNGEKLGPGAIYFFMDTTLGWKHTVILYCLVGVLVVFYGVFSVIEKYSDINQKDLKHHVTMMIGLMMLTCRFRD